MKNELLRLGRKYFGILVIFCACLLGVFSAQQQYSSYRLATYLGFLGRNLSSDIFLDPKDHTEVYKLIESGIRKKDPYFRIFSNEDEFAQSLSVISAASVKKYGIFFDTETAEVTDILRHSSNYQKLRVGDKLLRVNDETDPKQFLASFAKSGTSTLEILRDGKKQSVTVEASKLNPIYTEMKNGEAIITVYFFKTEILTQILDFLQSLDKNNVSQVTFDLRQCPGGKIVSMSAFLGFFLPEDTLLFYEKRQTKKIYYKTTRQPLLDLSKFSGPIRVLKSHRTASSAEIFAGTLNFYLKDRTNFKLVGETSYGKWTTIQFVKFLKGGMLHSIGHVYLPDDTTYEGIGI